MRRFCEAMVASSGHSTSSIDEIRYGKPFSLGSRHSAMVSNLHVTVFSHIRHTREILKGIKRRFRQLSNHKSEREEPHEDDPRKVPSGSAHGSGRLGAGICSWGKGTESKLNDNGQRQYVAVRNDAVRSPVLAVVGDIACQPGETEPSR